jgi:hypothetical protein
MTSVEAEEFQKYRTPRSNRSALVEPSLRELTELLIKPWQLSPNVASDGDAVGPLEFCGKSLEIARQQARVEVIDLARSYTQVYRDIPRDVFTDSTRLVMSGHQPELFHPGVWFKNFLLSRLAQAPGVIAINFLVDNDVCRSPAVRVPSRANNGNIVAQTVPFDTQLSSIPWELRRCDSEELWNSFPKRIEQCLISGLQQPLINEMWPMATESLRRNHRIGTAIAEARHRLEEKLGLSTLEVPLSSLVSTRAFARFSIQLLSELPRFQDCYNAQLLRYRTAHHIRNHAHPVPALEQDGGWLEAPWWIYRESHPRRQKLWVKLSNNQLIISDREGWQATIEGRLDCDNAATQWLELITDGICLRPRALLTTMYLRIMVSDLFLHGIGGGKYDQLTNAIMQEFFGVRPPPMAVATATLQLPIASDFGTTSSRLESEQQIRAERERVWKMRFNADAVRSEAVEFRELTDRKKQLLESMPQRGEKWEWHRAITAVNRRLSELASPRIADAKQTIEELTILERQQRIIESREFSFCLFPQDLIADALSKLAE